MKELKPGPKLKLETFSSNICSKIAHRQPQAISETQWEIGLSNWLSLEATNDLAQVLSPVTFKCLSCLSFTIMFIIVNHVYSKICILKTTKITDFSLRLRLLA